MQGPSQPGFSLIFFAVATGIEFCNLAGPGGGQLMSCTHISVCTLLKLLFSDSVFPCVPKKMQRSQLANYLLLNQRDLHLQFVSNKTYLIAPLSFQCFPCFCFPEWLCGFIAHRPLALSPQATSSSGKGTRSACEQPLLFAPQCANWSPRLLLSFSESVLKSLITLLFVANCHKLQRSSA